ncbi:MAG: chloride channel protein [Gemmatimonadetes bacterium]|nr:chloride channel protein [Gemmatimonadota bacterium]
MAAEARASGEGALDERAVALTLLAVLVGIGAAFAAQFLERLIYGVTNLAFHARWSVAHTEPMDVPRGVALLLVPMLGAAAVGVMARFGSRAIRGHGIPEVMERVLFGESRILARVMVLKPLSAAIAIGTGGPFGAEGPIIATGGALGSIAGQYVHVSADERKTLLAAGAAAGMAATFGTPLSAVLLAVELLLFEYRARSLVPVAMAAVTAAAMRVAFKGSAPVFAAAPFAAPGEAALAGYALLGALMGALAAGITTVTYAVEDLFERLPIPWMYWPLIGAMVVGACGLLEPRVLGIGYSNIVAALDGKTVGIALAVLVALKFIAWVAYLGSGTSGGTLAPLFTVGSGLGGLIGAAAARWVPALGVEPRVAALVGMAAVFAGCSHAVLASVVFAFETTRQPVGLLPLLAGCSAAYLVALLLRRTSIMTEKLARRGIEVRTEYSLDHLMRVSVREACVRDVRTLAASTRLDDARAALVQTPDGPQGFPVLDDEGRLQGVVLRRELLDLSLDGATRVGALAHGADEVAFEDETLRDAADRMVRTGAGRLPVVTREAPDRVVGIISRSDLLDAHATRLDEAHRRVRLRRLPLGALR